MGTGEGASPGLGSRGWHAFYCLL